MAYLFLLGPNTNLGHNSIVLMIEAQSRYISALVGSVIEARKAGGSLTISPKPEKLEQYNDELQTILGKTPYAHKACDSWYKNTDGQFFQC